MSTTGSHMVAAWSIEPAELNAMFIPPKYYRLLSPRNGSSDEHRG